MKTFVLNDFWTDAGQDKLEDWVLGQNEIEVVLNFGHPSLAIMWGHNMSKFYDIKFSPLRDDYIGQVKVIIKNPNAVN